MNMVRNYIVCLVLLFVFSPVFITPAEAHILKSDGSIGAVMHVTPEDDPIAGEESQFFFEFKDKEHKFSPDACECVISISQSGKEIFSQSLFSQHTDPGLTHASLSFTFPQRDVYTIKIIGKPFVQGTFSNFSLNYDIRVERISDNISQSTQNISPESKKSWLESHIPHIVIGIGSISLLLWIGIKNSSKHT